MHLLTKTGVAGVLALTLLGSVSAATVEYSSGTYVYGQGSGVNAEGYFVTNLDYEQWYVYGEGDARYVMLYPQEIARRFEGGVILKDVQVAIDFLFQNKISKYGTADTFHPEWNVRRDEVATLFRRTSRLIAPHIEGLGMPTISAACQFSDSAEAHADLRSVIQESCQLGLFKGSSGKFRPKAEVTNAEALAVLVRMMDGAKEEPATGHWATNYYMRARELGFTAGLAADSTANLDKPITRGDVAKLLEAASVYEQAWAALKPGDNQELIYVGASHQYQLRAK